jgi:hypothetical protein
MMTWFCNACASRQKGGVENVNGRLLRWLPRNIDVDWLLDEVIQEIVLTANLTERKCLGFKTPFQALLTELGKDVKSASFKPLRFAPESTQPSNLPQTIGCAMLTRCRLVRSANVVFCWDCSL